MSYFRAITQDVTADENNSSTTGSLPAGGWYYGAATSTLGVAGIQVSMKMDQNGEVFIDQSPDGSNWDISDSFTYLTTENFGVTVQAINSYVRVRVLNTSSVASTYLRLQTALCPIVEAVPRALDKDSNLKVHVFGIDDDYGFSVENTPLGEMRVVQPTRLVGTAFEGGAVDTNFWTSTVANSATVTASGTQISLNSGTNAAGSAKFNSTRRARWVTTTANVARLGIILNNVGLAGNRRRWGVAWGTAVATAISDGYYFQINGTTFSVVVMKGGLETRVSSGNFNGQLGSTYVLSTNATAFEIYWNAFNVYFVIDNRILHTFTVTTTPLSDTQEFHLYLDNLNTGNTTNAILTCLIASIRRLGQLLTQPTSKYQAGTVAALVLKTGAGNLHSIIISGVLNNAVVTLWDNTAASGTTIWASGSMGANTTPFALDLKGLPFFTGLTLTIATANANALVIYE